MRDYSSTQALHDFVHAHALIHSNGNMIFKAVVTIMTKEKKLINQEMKITVRFDGLGELSFSGYSLKPEKYPGLFNAKFQNFEHINHEYLMITGTHAQQPNIGNYQVEITTL